ncbi:MAG TPA: beta-L-arabinofuranosidase domain-containing protein [Mobilitalea sp.]|nr:beta-L-arabinofuranosidase domain-containing protein [Mobilitalea sp.]
MKDSSTEKVSDITADTAKQLKRLEAFELDRVYLTDGYYINATQKEIEYLLSFESDRLLAGFRETAGIDTKGVNRYAGWESLLIGGHTLGHYLTACVQAYQSANSGEEQKQLLLTMVSEIIQGLKDCQDALGTGFIFGAVILDKDKVELQFDNVEKNQTNIFTQAWVPWYTMHKIYEGLIAVAHLSDERTKKIADMALQIASRLGDWTYHRVSCWTSDIRRTVIGIEYGGMNDCLYDLYQMTKNNKHALAAHAFDQVELFEKVLKGKPGDHILNNHHANTTIPKFLGALNRYITYRDTAEDVELYLDYAKAFWEMVVKNHTYITGGNSEWEHFGLDDILDAERTNCNNETCNAYNMLKLTKKLYMITGEAKYTDYYENTFLNSILSSQNPITGMTTYFQPMATGYFKVFGERFNKFWCCTGSGMENFTKLGESFYYHKGNVLVVNQYISSELTWSEYNIKFIQNSSLPLKDKATFTVESKDGVKTDVTFAFRLPDWLASKAILCVNGSEYDYQAEGGYALVHGPFANGTKLELTLPMKVQTYHLPDSKNVYGFKYGPIVLSALLGAMDMEPSVTGVDVTIPLAKVIEPGYTRSGDDVITVMTDGVEEFLENIDQYILSSSSGDELSFQLTNTDANLTFVPHYSQYTQRYGIYWRFISKETPEQMKQESDNRKYSALRLDTVQPGYGQYENDALHNMTEYGTGSTGDTSVGTSRFANAMGAFSYRMIVDTENGTNLLATFKAADQGKTLRIKIGNTVVYEKLLQEAEKEEYDVIIELPKELLAANADELSVNEQTKSAVTFTFEGAKGEASARLYNFLYSLKVMSR